MELAVLITKPSGRGQSAMILLGTGGGGVQVFPGGIVAKNLPVSAGDTGLTPGSERPPGTGSGNPSQYPCLEKPMDRGAWQVTVHELVMTEHMHTNTCI